MRAERSSRTRLRYKETMKTYSPLLFARSRQQAPAGKGLSFSVLRPLTRIPCVRQSYDFGFPVSIHPTPRSTGVKNGVNRNVEIQNMLALSGIIQHLTCLSSPCNINDISRISNHILGFPRMAF